MNFLDTLGNLLDLSKKQENFTQDIKGLQNVLETLQEGLRQTDQSDLPLHITGLLTQHLGETENLLKNLSQRHRSWWSVVQKIVPGSDIRKLKEHYDQFLHINRVLNLYLAMGKKSKRSALSCLPLASEVMYGSLPTKRIRTVSARGLGEVNMLDVPLRKSATSMNFHSNVTLRNSLPARMNSLNRATSTNLGLTPIREEPENRGKLAFKLKLLYDVGLEETVGKYRIVERTIKDYWDDNSDEKEFIFRREDFNYLSKEGARLSREHALLRVTRKPKKKIVKGATENSNVMIEEEPLKKNNQEDDEYEYQYFLKDLSLNGTYYLKGGQAEDNNVNGVKIVGDFAHLTKNTEVELNHGDIIGLIMLRPNCKELTFGFQLFTH